MLTVACAGTGDEERISLDGAGRHVTMVSEISLPSLHLIGFIIMNMYLHGEGWIVSILTAAPPILLASESEAVSECRILSLRLRPSS